MSIPHDDPYAVHSITEDAGGDAVAGRVVWAPATSIWQGVMLAGALAAPFVVSWSGLGVFVALTGATLLVGHSVGFHRRLIHGSFQSPLWLDHLMMWLGTLVGMSGPLAMIAAHDLRDWGQRQPACHPYLANRAGFWTDYLWNLHGRLELATPPRQTIPARIAQDRFYRFLERTWMLQQLPVAIILFLLGGWPGSAKLGLYPGQADWGFVFIRLLERVGLAWDVRTPETLPERAELARA